MSKIHAISQEILVIHIAPAGSTQENNTLYLSSFWIAEPA